MELSNIIQDRRSSITVHRRLTNLLRFPGLNPTTCDQFNCYIIEEG